MFDLINGLPIHPLAVHAVTVLVPLAILGTIAIVVRPAWRDRYGMLVLIVAVAAMISVPVATSSGEALARRVGAPDFHHAQLADQLKFFIIPMVALLALFVIGVRRGRLHGTWRAGVAAAAVIAAIATGWQGLPRRRLGRKVGLARSGAVGDAPLIHRMGRSRT